jgi:hypothetical protein
VFGSEAAQGLEVSPIGAATKAAADASEAEAEVERELSD